MPVDKFNKWVVDGYFSVMYLANKLGEYLIFIVVPSIYRCVVLIVFVPEYVTMDTRPWKVS